jgi:hypothetical protein
MLLPIKDQLVGQLQGDFQHDSRPNQQAPLRATERAAWEMRCSAAKLIQ